jgi:hypothetical protein
LRSAHVNRDHAALIDEIKERLNLLTHTFAFQVDAIINFQDRMWLCYLDLRRAFPLARGVDCRLIELTYIKSNFRFALAGSIHSVSYKLVHRDICVNEVELISLLNKAFSCARLIVKPIVGMGGEGVSIVNRGKVWGLGPIKAAIVRAANAQKAVYSDRITAKLHELNNKLLPVNDYVLLEEFIEGTEYSLEGFVSDSGKVKHFLEQHKTVTHFEPTVRHLGYAFRNKTGKGAASVFAKAIIGACGISGWAFHIEAKGNFDRIRLVELNPRPGGGTIVDLVGLMHGCDLRQLCLNAILDGLTGKIWTGVAVIQPSQSGRLVACEGLDSVRRQPDCIFVRQLIPCGAAVSQEIEMYVVELGATGKTKPAATATAERLAQMIKLTIEGPS